MAAGLVVAGSAAGCGEEEPRDAAGAERKSQSAERVEGTLTTSDGRIVRDWGPERDRKSIVARFAEMQRDFRAGRMEDVCADVADFGLAQFTPGEADSDTPCPAKLRAFATELRRRRVAPARLRLLWVRAYSLVASIWVETGDGARVRIGFTDVDGRGMKLEVGTSIRPELLHGYLAGARSYQAR